MNNYRPLIAFTIIVLIVAAGFWGVLAFASHYNHRLATPQPVAQKPQAQPQNTPKNSQNNQPSKSTPESTPSQSTPSSSSSNNQPQPSSNSSSSSPKVAQTGPTHVPSAGLDAQNFVFASVLMSMSAYLLLRLRWQNSYLRLNR